MIRNVTDALIGVALGLLIASIAAGAYVAAQRTACHDAEVAASAWTSSNRDPSLPAALIPNCSGWENAMKGIVSVGLGGIVGAVGLVAIRLGSGGATRLAQ
ncbi:MAG: hypothetical protein WDA16_14065 [Candidatus Thermoplasmatota archaeon]